MLLFLSINHFFPLFFSIFNRISPDLLGLYSGNILLFECPNDCSCNIQFLCDKLILQYLLIKQCSQKSRPCLLILLQIFLKLCLPFFFT